MNGKKISLKKYIRRLTNWRIFLKPQVNGNKYIYGHHRIDNKKKSIPYMTDI